MYQGSTIDDREIHREVPPDFRKLLERCNGYVAFHGGFHVRGAVREPRWHSLRYWWLGEGALHRLFPAVESTDVPFGQDALGDQYLLRNETVYRLSGETGELDCLELELPAFDRLLREDPVGFLSLEPLQAYLGGGGVLQPGELLSVWPPFVFAESSAGVSYRAVPAEDRIRFLADLARQISQATERSGA